MPKRLLRAVIDVNGSPTPENSRLNFKRLTDSGFEWQKPADKTIYKFILGYFQHHLDCPSLIVLQDFFKQKDDVEVLERLQDILSAEVYERTNYIHLLSNLLDEQNKIKAVAALKEATDIATKGVTFGQGKFAVRKEGIKAAVIHATESLYPLIVEDTTQQTRGDIRTDTKASWDDYQTAKYSKDKAWGRFSGLEEIDTVCHGHKKGEMWVHAAFTGELKCLAGDTTVYDHSTQSVRTLKEIFTTQELPEVLAVENEGDSAYRLVRARASHIAENGIRPVHDLRLSSGRRIRATGNHPFLTPTGWVQLKELQPRDWVAVPKRIKAEGRSQFTDAEVKVVGYLLGDGHIKDYISFTAKNDIIREDFKDCLVEMGLKEGPADYRTPSFREELDDARWCVRVSHSSGDLYHRQVSPVRLILDSLGLFGTLSASKSIPNEFLSLPEDQTALLLGALWSTDGSCHCGDHPRSDRSSLSRRNDIKYQSISESLCLGVQALLLRLGIQSTITRVITEYNGQPYTFYCVTVVTNPSKRAFSRKIRVIGKEEQFSRLASRLPKNDNTPIPTNFIPDDAKAHLPHGGFRYASQMKNRPTMGVDVARLFLSYPSVKRAYHSDLNWEQVESIVEAGQEMTYDLSVPNHRSFVANDIVVHNSTFACNWAYNLVTRYRTNVLYVSLEMPYTQIRRQLHVIHTANKRFELQGIKPLDYRKVRDGDLTPTEEAFFQTALNDFETNSEYCSLEIWCPDHDVTIADIRTYAEIMHKRKEIGMLIIDHGGLVEPTKKNFKEYTVALNSVLRDSKKLALQFNHGEGIPVVMLFQLNRQGKNEADKAEGRYKISAIAYANECLAKGTLITTQRGLIPIEDVSLTDHVWGLSGWKQVKANLSNGRKRVVEVRTSTGRRLLVTGNHLFRELRDGELVWTKADELSGKYILSATEAWAGLSETPMPGIQFKRWEKPRGDQGIPLEAPRVLTTELAYILGAHAGDGTLSQGTVKFTGNRKEKAVLHRIRTAFKKAFRHTIGATLYNPSRPGSFDLCKSSKALQRWFESMGTRTAGIPSCILSSNVACRKAFLQGLWDTDGWVNSQGTIGLSQMRAHRLTLEHAQLLLSGLGIPSTLYDYETRLNGKVYPQTTLVVTSRGVEAFAKCVNFSEPHKRKRVLSRARQIRKSNEYWPVGQVVNDLMTDYVVPYQRLGKAQKKLLRAFVSDSMSLMQLHKSSRLGSTQFVWTTLRSLVNRGLVEKVSTGLYRRKTRSPIVSLPKRVGVCFRKGLVPRSTVSTILDSLVKAGVDDARVRFLQCLLGGVIPELVTSVQPAGYEDVYDLTVGGDHEYTTGGVLTHNCERSADVITTTYLNDQHRDEGTTLFCNLKNRDNPLFKPFVAAVDFSCRRIRNVDKFNAPGMGVVDPADMAFEV